jgi:hypothetical protein
MKCCCHCIMFMHVFHGAKFSKSGGCSFRMTWRCDTNVTDQVGLLSLKKENAWQAVMFAQGKESEYFSSSFIIERICLGHKFHVRGISSSTFCTKQQ